MNQIGKKTPVFTRFSTVAGERGAPDIVRDPRGFSVKHYTEEGIYDFVGNNTPVFFIRDAIKFPDFIHTQKSDPKTGRPNNDAAWDFWSKHPECLHQLTVLFSDRGTPDGFRHMNGYSSHTFKWVNADGEQFFVQYHYKTDAGIKNHTQKQVDEMMASSPDHSKKDLYEHIESGKTASWTLYVQIMPVEEAKDYRFDVFDITKVWPHSDYPLHEVGKLVLNRNPENWFAEVEQAAFSPGNLVPGVEASNDKMLQGRLFSYPDTHRHRLGRNFDQIPINNSYRSQKNVYSRDGESRVDGNSGSSVNYEPNTRGGPTPDPKYKRSEFEVEGKAGRFAYTHPNCNYEQPRALFKKVMTETDREHLCQNIAGHMEPARHEVKLRSLKHFFQIDQDYGERICKYMKIDPTEVTSQKEARL